MILHIDTTQGDDIIIAIKDGNRVVVQKKFKAKHSQAEKLLPAIDKLLKSKRISIKTIKKIKIANFDGGFTALRIGVVTANALGYALSIPVEPSESPSRFDYSEARRAGDSDEVKESSPEILAKRKNSENKPKKAKNKKKFDIVEPIYSKEPNITTHNA